MTCWKYNGKRKAWETTEEEMGTTCVHTQFTQCTVLTKTPNVNDSVCWHKSCSALQKEPSHSQAFPSLHHLHNSDLGAAGRAPFLSFVVSVQVSWYLLSRLSASSEADEIPSLQLENHGTSMNRNQLSLQVSLQPPQHLVLSFLKALILLGCNALATHLLPSCECEDVYRTLCDLRYQLSTALGQC